MFEVGSRSGLEELAERVRLEESASWMTKGICGVEVSVADLLAAVATQFQGSEAGLMANLPGGKLIHGDADLDVRAVGLLRLAPGEKRRGGPRVIAGTVAVGLGLVVGETGQHLKIPAVCLKWFQSGRQFKIAAFLSREEARRQGLRLQSLF